MSFKRTLNLKKLLKRNSFFLFGPRAVGKSYLIKEQLSKTACIIDLLDSRYFLELSQHPYNLESIILAENPKPQSVVIDEIQKLPFLLDEVHRLMEKHKWKFLLTGSSMRNLKKKKVNLLAGRAWSAELFSLHFHEIPDFSLKRHSLYGSLPRVLLTEEPNKELKNYVKNYLEQEIQMESYTRNLAVFSRFLEGASFSNGKILNFQKLGSDFNLSPSMVREYYFILEDTLLGFLIPPWKKGRHRKVVSTSKFYFFDLGVSSALKNLKSMERNSDIFGEAFEHWIALELRAYISYFEKDEVLHFWRTHSGHEVDFIIGDTVVEVKASSKISQRDTKGLKKIKEEKKWKNLLLVSQDSKKMNYENIQCLHWKEFLENLWSGKYF